MNKRLKLFELLKKDSLELFDGSHAIHTPKDLVNDVLKKVNLNTGNILVVFNIEFVISLIEEFNCLPSNITFYSDHKNKSYLASKFKVKYITDLEATMKFDVIIGSISINYESFTLLHLLYLYLVGLKSCK